MTVRQYVFALLLILAPLLLGANPRRGSTDAGGSVSIATYGGRGDLVFGTTCSTTPPYACTVQPTANTNNGPALQAAIQQACTIGPKKITFPPSDTGYAFWPTLGATNQPFSAIIPRMGQSISVGGPEHNCDGLVIDGQGALLTVIHKGHGTRAPYLLSACHWDAAVQSCQLQPIADDTTGANPLLWDDPRAHIEFRNMRLHDVDPAMSCNWGTGDEFEVQECVVGNEFTCCSGAGVGTCAAQCLYTEESHSISVNGGQHARIINVHCEHIGDECIVVSHAPTVLIDNLTSKNSPAIPMSNGSTMDLTCSQVITIRNSRLDPGTNGSVNNDGLQRSNRAIDVGTSVCEANLSRCVDLWSDAGVPQTTGAPDEWCDINPTVTSKPPVVLNIENVTIIEDDLVEANQGNQGIVLTADDWPMIVNISNTNIEVPRHVGKDAIAIGYSVQNLPFQTNIDGSYFSGSLELSSNLHGSSLALTNSIVDGTQHPGPTENRFGVSARAGTVLIENSRITNWGDIALKISGSNQAFQRVAIRDSIISGLRDPFSASSLLVDTTGFGNCSDSMMSEAGSLTIDNTDVIILSDDPTNHVTRPLRLSTGCFRNSYFTNNRYYANDQPTDDLLYGWCQIHGNTIMDSSSEAAISGIPPLGCSVTNNTIKYVDPNASTGVIELDANSTGTTVTGNRIWAASSDAPILEVTGAAYNMISGNHVLLSLDILARGVWTPDDTNDEYPEKGEAVSWEGGDTGTVAMWHRDASVIEITPDDPATDILAAGNTITGTNAWTFLLSSASNPIPVGPTALDSLPLISGGSDTAGWRDTTCADPGAVTNGSYCDRNIYNDGNFD